jgi:predicted metalloprotease with PDZ domain
MGVAVNRHLVAVAIGAAIAVTAVAGVRTPAAAAGTIDLYVDASTAVPGLIHIHERIPVTPGPMTLDYPMWIPGDHGPDGPIENVAGLHVHAGSTELRWKRDPILLYTVHVDVPTGTSSIDVDFEYLGSQQGPHSGSPRFSTPNLFSLEWNEVVLTPAAAHDSDVMLQPTIRLPSRAWQYATALETESAEGGVIRFKPVSLEQLVDSPLDAGINERLIDLGDWDGAPVKIAVFGDTPDQLAASDARINQLRALVTQMHALYRYHHWNHYTFLLTVSDVMPGEGLEHHQSSDNGSSGSFLTDDDSFVTSADLLSHEFNHSWDGKYRRPFDLATPNLQQPMIDDNLWVYEGMTQFYGNLQAARAGMRTEQQWLDGLAMLDAYYSAEHGRLWRPLEDTATSASFLYSARGPWLSERRSVDYYSEGELMWLEADVTIHKLTGGARSLDDVARAFFGGPGNTGPMVVPYTRADLIAALNAVAPYDWAGFFAKRVDDVAPLPPDPFTPGGYRLVFTDTPSAFEKTVNGKRKSIDARFSLGLNIDDTGVILDVYPGSVAFNAGIGPGEKIVAVNGRSYDDRDSLEKGLDSALRAARSGDPLQLLLSAGKVYRTVSLVYRDGPRYPHLVRIAGTDDILGKIATPLKLAP